MQKYRTEVRPFSALKRGDLVLVSFGIIVLARVEEQPDGRMTLHSTTQPPVTYHSSNWPEVVVGFSDEWLAAYPEVTDGDLAGDFTTGDHGDL